MPRRLVTITALGSLACNPFAREQGEAPEIGNPPEPADAGLPPLEERQAKRSTAALPDKPTSGLPFQGYLNPRHSDHGTIYLSYSGTSCYVNLPFPEGQPIPPPGSPQPQEIVPCPAEMAHPAWLECAGGDVAAVEGEDACLCFHIGNPPPPARWVHCPK